MNILSVSQCIWFALPFIIANVVPVLVKKFDFLAVPIDMNKTLKGEPIFGKNKTIRGFVAGCLAGIIVFSLQKHLYQFEFFQNISLINYDNHNILFGFLLGFGAMFGDLVKSFFKRRLNIPAGESWFPFDQVDFILGALAFGSMVYVSIWDEILVGAWKELLTILVAGFLLHLLGNRIAFSLGIKKTKI